jgi:hypothetical protein
MAYPWQPRCEPLPPRPETCPPVRVLLPERMKYLPCLRNLQPAASLSARASCLKVSAGKQGRLKPGGAGRAVWRPRVLGAVHAGGMTEGGPGYHFSQQQDYQYHVRKPRPPMARVAPIGSRTDCFAAPQTQPVMGVHSHALHVYPQQQSLPQMQPLGMMSQQVSSMPQMQMMHTSMHHAPMAGHHQQPPLSSLQQMQSMQLPLHSLSPAGHPHPHSHSLKAPEIMAEDDDGCAASFVAATLRAQRARCPFAASRPRRHIDDDMPMGANLGSALENPHAEIETQLVDLFGMFTGMQTQLMQARCARVPARRRVGAADVLMADHLCHAFLSERRRQQPFPADGDVRDCSACGPRGLTPHGRTGNVSTATAWSCSTPTARSPAFSSGLRRSARSARLPGSVCADASPRLCGGSGAAGSG